MDLDQLERNIRCENLQVVISWLPEKLVFNVSMYQNKRVFGTRSRDLGKALRKLFKEVCRE